METFGIHFIKIITVRLGAKSLTEETVYSRTGLYRKSFQWIVKEGFASEDAAERIADAIGATMGEILLPEITGDVENVIEFTKDRERASVTFCQGRYKSRKKGGRYNDYIFRAYTDWYLHCCPCKFVLYNLQGKKIAATTRNSDGQPCKGL